MNIISENDPWKIAQCQNLIFVMSKWSEDYRNLWGESGMSLLIGPLLTIDWLMVCKKTLVNKYWMFGWTFHDSDYLIRQSCTKCFFHDSLFPLTGIKGRVLLVHPDQLVCYTDFTVCSKPPKYVGSMIFHPTQPTKLFCKYAELVWLIGLWEMWMLSWISHFLTCVMDSYLEYFLLNWSQVNAIRPQWWLVNIGSGNGMVP